MPLRRWGDCALLFVERMCVDNDFNWVKMADDDHTSNLLLWQFIIIALGAILVFSEHARRWLHRSAIFLVDFLRPDVWP